MSWSRAIAHTSKDDAATQLKTLRGDGIPAVVADLIQQELDGLPDKSQVTISTYGHLGWGESQTGGQISVHFTIDVQAPPPEPEIT